MTDKKDRWDKGVALCTMLSLLAVPAGVAYFGNKWQMANAEQQIRKEYVQLAVSILSTRPISKGDPLRPWAIEILNDNSEVKLSGVQMSALQVGEYARKSDHAGKVEMVPLPLWNRNQNEEQLPVIKREP